MRHSKVRLIGFAEAITALALLLSSSEGYEQWVQRIDRAKPQTSMTMIMQGDIGAMQGRGDDGFSES